MIDQQTLERCQALNARAEAMSFPRIGADCRLTLEVGFFFDGMGRHLEQDLRENRVSNIGRLFSAFPGKAQSQPGHAFRAVYVSGLGTPYQATLGEGIDGALQRAPADMDTAATGHIGTNTLGAAAETALQDSSQGHWWEVFGRSLKASFARPWEWVKSARDAAVRTGAEAFGPLRDHPFTANLLMSGAATRQAAAIEQFQGAVNDATQGSQMPLGTIRVSVFGFDFGAALAKAFVRELLEQTCQRDGEGYRYRGAEVQIVFAGLFDCVDRTHPKLGPVDWFHPLTPVLDDGGPLHPACRRALHLIAAHERRFYRRCRPLGPLQAHWNETLQPGISEDIGGGLKPDEQKISAELARAALHRMYRSAMMAGVPLPILDELPKRGRQLAKLFELNDRVEGHSLLALSRHYAGFAGDSLSPSEAHFRRHAWTYLAWLAWRYRDYRDTRAALQARRDGLPDRTPSGALGVPTASLSMAPDAWQALEATADELEQALEQLETDWGWLEEVDQEARQLRALFLTADTTIRRQAKRTLEGEYQLAEDWLRWTRETRPPSLPEEVELLFAYGLHDKRPEEQRMRNRQSSTLTGGYHFFAWRRLDPPD